MGTVAKNTMVAETFGRHPSDQCRAFNYLLIGIYTTLITIWRRVSFNGADNGLMERSAITIEEKLGACFDGRYVGFIDCNCLRTERPGGRLLEEGPTTFKDHFIMAGSLSTV